MKGLWSQRWKKALIWLSGYVHFIAFAVAGGFVVFKTADKDLHKTAKTVFIATLIFTAIEALLLILSGIASLGGKHGARAQLDQLFRDACQDRRLCRGDSFFALLGRGYGNGDGKGCDEKGCRGERLCADGREIFFRRDIFLRRGGKITHRIGGASKNRLRPPRKNGAAGAENAKSPHGFPKKSAESVDKALLRV